MSCRKFSLMLLTLLTLQGPAHFQAALAQPVPVTARAAAQASADADDDDFFCCVVEVLVLAGVVAIGVLGATLIVRLLDQPESP